MSSFISEMDNFTVAVHLIDRQIRFNHDAFKLFETFSSRQGIKLQYEFWKDCNSAEKVDAFILDPEAVLKCEKNIRLPKIIEHQALAIMTPANEDYSKIKNLLVATDDFVWVLSFFTIIMFSLILNIGNKIYSKKVDFIKDVLVGFKLAIGQPTKLPSKKSSVSRFLHMLIVIFGFVLCNSYSMYVTQNIIKPSDYSNTTILCTKPRLRFLNSFQYKQKFNFQLVDPKEYVLNLSSLNTSYGYCVRTLDWDKKLQFQKDMKTNIFNLKTRWFQGFQDHTLILMKINSKFTASLDNFILRSYSAGLVKKWGCEMSAKRFITMLRKNHFPDKILYQHFQIILCYFGIGSLLSFCCFVIENFVSIHLKNIFK